MHPSEALNARWSDIRRTDSGEEIWIRLPKTTRSGIKIKRIRIESGLQDLIKRIKDTRYWAWIVWLPISDLRPKAATDKERVEGMNKARRFLGHTTEKQTPDYVRNRIRELVRPVHVAFPEWMAKVLSPKDADKTAWYFSKSLIYMETRVGIEPAYTALQAAA